MQSLKDANKRFQTRFLKQFCVSGVHAAPAVALLRYALQENRTGVIGTFAAV